MAGFPEPEYTQGFIYGPADIEGHIGRDGRNYIIDLARVCPPVAKHVTYVVTEKEYAEAMELDPKPSASKNKKTKKSGRKDTPSPPPTPVHLYRLFRPEFLAR